MSSGKPVLPSWLSEGVNCCLLTVPVQPGARGAGVVGEHGDALKIRIDSPPVDGRANQALIAFLADRLGLARSNLKLISGESSRRKRIQVSGLGAVTIVRSLST
jgi:uncharacterized protein (TIGR00251 family)